MGPPTCFHSLKNAKNLFCKPPIICLCTSIKMIIYLYFFLFICTCQHTVMVNNVSHYNFITQASCFSMLHSFSVSEFISDIFHALCINSTLTSLKLGENILGELFQVSVCVVKPLSYEIIKTVQFLAVSQCLPLFSCFLCLVLFQLHCGIIFSYFSQFPLFSTPTFQPFLPFLPYPLPPLFSWVPPPPPIVLH